MELTLNVLARRLMDTLQADAAAVHRFDPALQTIQHVASVGFRTARIRETNQQIAVGQAGQAAYQRQPIYYPDLNSEPVEFARAGLIQDENFQAYFAVPLLSKGEIMGVMEVFLRSPLEPEEEWIQFLETMAGQAALAIDHLNLFQDLQRSNLQLTQAYHQVIEGWARALELKDKETEGHSRRVVRLTLAVAEKLGLRKEQLADLRQGALLHDIGKMGIPDRIIQKPGPLDDSEWELMKKHPLFAYEMLKPISHLEGAVEIPYSHHERWDGSGYPQGLQGEEIPLSARIFAVVDVWDALLSDRPYRKAWSEDKAVTYIKEQSGKQFDPRVVSALMEMINQDHPALNR
jgi:putative nucleotidyltransferase with HDIG domain